MSNRPSKEASASSSSKANNKLSVTENKTNICDDHEIEEQVNQESVVTSHLFIKPNGTLEKDAILRRIRHRKRVDMVKNAVQSLIGSPDNATGKTRNVLAREKSWIDDAFSAP